MDYACFEKLRDCVLVYAQIDVDRQVPKDGQPH